MGVVTSSEVLEVPCSGGSVTLTRYSHDQADDVHLLVRKERDLASRSRRAWVAALVGGPLIAIVLWVALYAMLGLSPGSSFANVLADLLFEGPMCCVAPLCLPLAYAIGLATHEPVERRSLVVQFEQTVSVDGQDVGRLVRVESDASRPEIVLVTEHNRTLVELENAADARAMADAITRAVGTMPQVRS
jgi:hypothetical protein